MPWIIRNIPNFLTLGNLLSGCIGIWMAVQGNIDLAVIAMAIGMVFDFLDGFSARVLKVTGAFGKELDSLADMITFGVLPSFLAMWTLENGIGLGLVNVEDDSWWGLTGLLIAAGAAFRLARFNIETQEGTGFKGLPTPITALFFASLAYSVFSEGIWIETLASRELVILWILILSLLMNSRVELIGLKFTSTSIKENWDKYLLIIVGVVLFVFLNFAAIPPILVSYFIISIISKYVS